MKWSVGKDGIGDVCEDHINEACVGMLVTVKEVLSHVTLVFPDLQEIEAGESQVGSQPGLPSEMFPAQKTKVLECVKDLLCAACA